MKVKILNTIGEKFAPEAKEILGGFAQVDYEIPSQEELKEIVGNYNALVVGLGLNFSADILSKATNLKYIATATTGLDHIDLDFAAKKGIQVLSLRGENEFLNTITGTAELALCLMLELARKTPFGFEAVKKGEWRRGDFMGASLYGKTLGILGLGRLGAMMARYGEALGMKVIYTDIEKKGTPTTWRKVDLGELLRDSDILTIHVHLKKDTENMIGEKELGEMKSTAFLINTSRGKIVDEGAVLNALENKKIGGYGTDVLSGELEFKEIIPADHLLVSYARTHQNCVITPHIGGMTSDSRFATDIFIANKLKKAVLNQVKY